MVYLGSLKKINFPSKVKLPNLVFLSTWKSGAREKIVFLSALITQSAFISPVESPPLLVASWRLDSLYQVDSKSLDFHFQIHLCQLCLLLLHCQIPLKLQHLLLLPKL